MQLSVRACNPVFAAAAAAPAADLQMVNMSLRLLSKPNEDNLPNIFKVCSLCIAAHAQLLMPTSHCVSTVHGFACAPLYVYSSVWRTA